MLYEANVPIQPRKRTNLFPQNKMMRKALRQCQISITPKKYIKIITHMVHCQLQNPKLIINKPNPSHSYNHTHSAFVRTNTSAHHFCTSPPHAFAVTRSEPELVVPANPTPREVKQLSFLDDKHSLRFLVPVIQIYRHHPSMTGADPGRVIRDALARALVFYYPLAGRLREGPDGRLAVDCTGEGVRFVEADADVEVAQLGDPPNFLPWVEEFLYDVPTWGCILDSPLLYIQVTRMKCGGFVLTVRMNHVLCDGAGLAQFLSAVGQIARGAHTPLVAPTWSRELFTAPPSVRMRRDQHDPPSPNPDLIQRSIFLKLSDLLATRALAPERSTTFEILTACVWRSLMSVLELEPEKKVRLIFPINARDKANRVVPAGYYGNAIAVAMITTSAGELRERPMTYAVGLVRKAKEEGAKDCMTWRTDAPTIGMNRFEYPCDKLLLVTDSRRLGLGEADFGWGEAAYANLARVGFEGVVSLGGFRNVEGEDGILMSTCLEAHTMKRFETHLNDALIHPSRIS